MAEARRPRPSLGAQAMGPLPAAPAAISHCRVKGCEAAVSPAVWSTAMGCWTCVCRRATHPHRLAAHGEAWTTQAHRQKIVREQQEAQEEARTLQDKEDEDSAAPLRAPLDNEDASLASLAGQQSPPKEPRPQSPPGSPRRRLHPAYDRLLKAETSVALLKRDLHAKDCEVQGKRAKMAEAEKKVEDQAERLRSSRAVFCRLAEEKAALTEKLKTADAQEARRKRELEEAKRAK